MDWDDQLGATAGIAVGVLQMADPGGFRKRSLAMWESWNGIDRRPPPMNSAFHCRPSLAEGRIRQPALRQALAGRVAPSVLARVCALSGGRWYEHLDPNAIRAVAASGEDRVIDFQAIRAAANSWPMADGMSGHLYRYRTGRLRALSQRPSARWCVEPARLIRANYIRSAG